MENARGGGRASCSRCPTTTRSTASTRRWRRARCTACASSPPPRSRPSTGPTRTCTCSATGSTTAAALLGERLLDARARPRAPRRRDGRPPARARLRGRPGADRGAQGRGQAGRPAAPGRRGARAPRQRRAARRGGTRRRLLVHPRLPDPGHAGLRRPHPPDRRGGDRLDPRGGRRGGLGAPVLGHRGRRTRCSRRSTATARPASTASRSSTRPTPRSRSRLLADRCTELGPAHDRLVGLPRPRPPAVQHASAASTCTAASRTSARSRSGRSPRPTRGMDGLCVWLTGPVGLGQVDDRPAGRRPAARPRPPRRGARRRRRAPEPLLRPRLLARGPRRERAPAGLGLGPAQPQRRDHVRRGRVALPRPARRRPRAHGQALRSRSTSRPRWRNASGAT